MTILLLYCGNKAVGKDVLMSNFIHDAIKLSYVLYYKQNRLLALSSAVQFVESTLLGRLLQSPTEAVADPLPKHLLFGLWSSSVQCYQVLEGGCSRPYMGTVNNSDKI